MQGWPVPNNVKQLREFLGLTVYYRKIIRDYVVKSKPLTTLLKKNAFQWSVDAQQAFETLKKVEVQALVLALPDFNKTLQWKQMLQGWLQSQTYKKDKYALVDRILRRKGKIMVGNVLQLRLLIVQNYHADAMGGHSGTVVTLHRLKEILYWKGMQKLVKQFVFSEDGITIIASQIESYYGVPLIKDEDSCFSIEMVRIEYEWKPPRCDLCKIFGHRDNGKTRPTDGGKFGSQSIKQSVRYEPKVASNMLKTGAANVVNISKSGSSYMSSTSKNQSNKAIVPLTSPRRSLGVDKGGIIMSNSYAALDAESEEEVESVFDESVNLLNSKTGASLFTYMVADVQLKMSTAYHPQTDGQTEIVNKCLECFLRSMTGEKPKEWAMWLPMAEFWGDNMVKKVDRTMHAREESLQMVKLYLKRAQDRMVSQALNTEVTELLKLVCRLQLPPNSQVHPVFHVSQLKLCKGSSHKTRLLPHCGPNDLLSAEPIAILDRKLAKVNNRAVAYVLVKWSNHTCEDAT
uniref:Integrase zinc-binding domain-containing protein n=1 Tax=Tanacetum cinerariifolium TaxID=118510 RepID=A0A699HMX2_TANCI|nr:hypothetical protein [Tanacetum cinerariifolium]